MPQQRRLSAVPENARRAGLYVRVSDVGGREADRFHSPDLQLQAMREHAARQGLAEVDVWSDIDVSGRTFDRAGIQLAIAAAESRLIDALVVYDLSRLGRNTGETLRVIDRLRKAGVSVVSTVERIDDTPEGQFMLSQFLSMAQLYSDQLGRRWRQVHEHMHADGRQVGQPPIGYVQADTGRTTATGRRVRSGDFTVDPVLGPVIADLFRDYAAGARVRDLADRISAVRGRPFWPAQVRATLRRRFYLGEVRRGDSWAPGKHEPLVDRATWDACQRRLDRDSREPSRRLQRAHALSGIAVCDQCGGKVELRIPAPSSRQAGQRRLGCGRQVTTKTCTGCGSMRVDLIEAYVRRWLEDYLRDLKVDTAAQADRVSRQARARSEAVSLRVELKRNRQAQTRLLTQLAMLDVDRETFTASQQELRDAEQRIVTALAEAETRQGATPRQTAQAVTRVLRLWDDAEPHELQRLLAGIIAEVRLLPAAFYRQPVDERVIVNPL